MGGDDGLLFYKRLIPVSLKVLKKGGFIAFEIGYDGGHALERLATEYGLGIQIIKDYSGNDRVAVLRR